MGESEGREGEGRPAESGPVPEGVAADAVGAADPASREELSPFPASRRSAGTLDLAVANDEPTQLIRYLVIAAHENVADSEHSREWHALLSYFERAHNELQRMQEPAPRPKR